MEWWSKGFVGFYLAPNSPPHPTMEMIMEKMSSRMLRWGGTTILSDGGKKHPFYVIYNWTQVTLDTMIGCLISGQICYYWNWTKYWKRHFCDLASVSNTPNFIDPCKIWHPLLCWKMYNCNNASHCNAMNEVCPLCRQFLHQASGNISLSVLIFAWIQYKYVMANRLWLWPEIVQNYDNFVEQ